MPVDTALKAIAEPRRRAILRLVRDEERTAGDIAGSFKDVTGPAVSQHLKVLVDAGLVTVRRDGRRRWYRARPEGLRGLQEYLEELWRTSGGPDGGSRERGTEEAAWRRSEAELRRSTSRCE